jgi:hypothetical protein
MVDDADKNKGVEASGAKATEEEYRQLMIALLKKMELLETVGERLTKLEAGQHEILHARAPEVLNLRKEGPMGHTRFHKLDFPTFDGGGDPLPFLNRCEHYFRGQRTVEEEKVWLAAHHLHGAAQQWYMRLERDEGTPGWRHFSELLDMRFGPPLRSNPLGELAACRRTSTVADYQERFLALLTRAGPLTEAQQIQLFVAGLQDPLGIDVQLQGPQSLEVAMSLARDHERREQEAAQQVAATQQSRGIRPPPSRGLLPAPPPLLPLPASPPSSTPTPASSSQRPAASAPNTVTVAGRTVRRLSPDQIDERRRNGQCFNCDEKYVRGHNRVCAKRFSLELHDGDDDDDADAPEEPRISLLAIAGVRTRNTMQVVVRFGAVTVTTLLDSGSTHNFVSAPAAAHCGLCFIPRTDINVTVANEDKVPATGVFREAPFNIGSEAFRADFFVLPLGRYDMVLGTDWLATLGPILWDFGRHTMSFWRHGHRVRWRGVTGPNTPQLRVCAMSAGRDLLDLLLAEFMDVFKTPSGLPPPRARDHHIHLLPPRRWLSAPTDTRSYRKMNWRSNAAPWNNRGSFVEAPRRSPHQFYW